MEQIIIALITAGLSLVGVMITNYFNNKSLSDKVTHQLEVAQAVTDTKIEELTREVRTHNNFAQRIPVMEEKIVVANHRIDDLERHEEKVRKI
jgi:alpha-acetolactate decarboxylase